MSDSIRRGFMRLLPPHRGGRIAVLIALLAAAGFFVAAKKYPSGKSHERVAAAQAKGETAHWNHYVNVWVPRASAASGLLCAVLLLGGRWFFQPRRAGGTDAGAGDRGKEPGSAGEGAAPEQGRAGWSLVLVTLGCMLWAGFHNAPRLNQGLWADEESTMRKYAVGDYNREADGTMKFRPVTWGDTLFRYRDPNNHILHTVLARATHEAFGDPAREGWYFDARALRIPAFVCGLGMFAAVAWLAWLLRMPLAGRSAVLLLAASPWAIQISTEARGYAVELLLVPLVVCFALRSLQTNRWVWWLAFGLGQFLILWTWPAAVHLLLLLNAAVLWQVVRGADRWVMLARFAAAGCVALIPALHVLLPIAQPLMNYLRIPRMQGTQPAAWYADIFTLLTTGMPWQAWSQSPLYFCWQRFSPQSCALILGGAAVLLGMGARELWQRGGGARVLCLVALLHAPVVVAHAALKGNMLYYLYVSLSLPLVALVCGAGGEALMRRVPGLFPRRSLLASATGGACAGFLTALILFVTIPARKIVRAHATEPYAAAAAATRTVRDPAHPDYDRVVVFAPAMATYGYDPGAIEFYQADREFAEHLQGWKAAGLWPADLQLESDDDARAFAALARHAHGAGKPFYVHVGVPGFTESVRPQIWALIRNPALFERTAVFHGIDSYPTARTREIYRFTGNVAALPPG